ncbi:JM157 [macacine gammaherpesvirus 11]|uniref:JM157 n=2 Tax=macacine gammaherpesvirus 11 TaxID=2560570 RepID=G9JMY4_9GAMA|nr:JM157 [Macaca fuscata rhadinovirus]AAT00134.1 JM157 [Macaca fuscata rhadinovirus]AEW87681.1 JM157 [Macaca fuscata rhadinovirus]AEW87851.1 JM157 [Macaca fuscata rhadinovirus]
MALRVGGNLFEKDLLPPGVKHRHRPCVFNHVGRNYINAAAGDARHGSVRSSNALCGGPRALYRVPWVRVNNSPQRSYRYLAKTGIA